MLARTDIIVSQQAEGSTVNVDSKPNVWFSLPAERRAERNVKSLFEELDKKALKRQRTKNIKIQGMVVIHY